MPCPPLLATFHAYPDNASGAAISAHDLFAVLRPLGWTMRVFSGPEQDRSTQSLFSALRAGNKSITTRTHSAFRLHHFQDDGVPVTAYDITPPNSDNVRMAFPFLQLLECSLRTNRPDLLLVYGGGWFGRALLTLAKHHQIPTVFWLRNHAYLHKDLFDDAASICVSSPFTRDYYHERLGITPVAIPSPVLGDRIIAKDREPRYVTFVNPLPAKGLFFFAGIAKELQRVRPDIPILVVESRAGAENLKALGLTGVHIHPHTTDPREFYRQTKLLLVPSLWNESFGRVVVEAQLNAIPVLSSSRGNLRDTVGSGGIVFDIPAKYTPESKIIPPAADVRPWIDAIVRLWDDRAEYARLSNAAQAASDRFKESAVAAQYDTYLRSLLSPTPSPLDSAVPRIIQRITPFFTKPPRVEDFRNCRRV